MRAVDLTMNSEATQAELEAGRGYEALFVPALFGPWTKHLVNSVGAEAGSEILDIACGSGVLARHLLTKAGSSGCVVGLDLTPGMIVVAQEVEPDIEWVLGTAEELPHADNLFDGVTCQFGMMFFNDRKKAVREMKRVLKPGGKLAVAVWNAIEHNPAHGAMRDLLNTEVSTAAGDAIQSPYSLGNTREVVETLDEAGFTNIKSEAVIEQGVFPDLGTMVEAELRGWLPLFGINLDNNKIADVVAKAGGRLGKHVTASGTVEFPASALLFSANKPN